MPKLYSQRHVRTLLGCSTTSDLFI